MNHEFENKKSNCCLFNFIDPVVACCMLHVALAAFSDFGVLRAHQDGEVRIKLPRKRDKWVAAKGESFTIYSNDKGKNVQKIVRKLERLRNVLGLMTSQRAVNAPIPTTIFLLKKKKIFESYIPLVNGKPANIVGYFLGQPEGNFIVLNADVDALPTVYHEFIHFFVNNNLARVPLWFDEGIAEYYSTFSSDEKGVDLGRPISSHLRFLRNEKLMPLSEFLNVSRASSAYNEGTRQGVFYAQSWLLVHYLFHNKGGVLRNNLAHYLSKIAGGMNSHDAFVNSFQMSFIDAEKELLLYLKKFTMNYDRITTKEILRLSNANVSRVPYDEILFQLGNLLAQFGQERIADAEFLFNAALSESPQSGKSHAGLGRIAADAGRHTDAEAHFKRAVALSPDDAWSQYQYASFLMQAKVNPGRIVYGKSNSARKAARMARAGFEKSIALDSTFAESWAGLGKTYLFEDDASALKKGIDASEAALMRMPSRVDIVMDLLTFYVRSDNSANVDFLMDRIIRPRNNKWEIKQAEEIIVFNLMNKAEVYARKGKGALTLKQLQKIEGLTNDPDVLARSKQLREEIARNGQRHALRQAFQKANAGEFSASLALLDDVLASSQDASFVNEVKRARKEIAVGQQAQWLNQARDHFFAGQIKDAKRLLQKILDNPLDPQLTEKARNNMKLLKNRDGNK